MNQKARTRITSLSLTALIVFAILLAGPASAVKVGFIGFQPVVNQGETTSFLAYVDIETNERIPIQNLTLEITGSSDSVTCVFNVDGTPISGCDNITIVSMNNYVHYGYGYMFGYGYGYDGSVWSTQNITFGYGYGYNYGYGYGYENQQGYATSELVYNITWNTTGFSYGNYNVRLEANANNNNQNYKFSSTTETIYVVPTQIIKTQSISSIPANTSKSSGLIKTPLGSIESSEYIIHTNGTTPPVEITVDVRINPPAGIPNMSDMSGVMTDFYYTIDVNDTSWYDYVSAIELRMYYNQTKVEAAGLNESKLVPIRFNGTTWVRLDCDAFGGCPADMGDNSSGSTIIVKLYGSGVNTTANYVWANLSHFSSYGIGEKNYTAPSTTTTTTTTTSTTTTTIAASGGLSTTPSSSAYSPTKATGYVGKAYAGDMKTFDMSKASDLGVESVDITFASDVMNVRITIEKLSEMPSTVTTPVGVITSSGGLVYAYLQIDCTVSNDDIDSATIRFKVPKSWVTENEVNPDTIALSRYADNAWTKLTTTRTGEDDDYYYFSATTTGFSVFAITGEPVSAVPTTTTTIAPATTTTVPGVTTTTIPVTTTTLPSEEETPAWMWALVVIVIVAIGFAYWKREKIERFIKKLKK